MKTVRPARFSTRVSAALKLIYLQVSRTSVYGKEITTGIVCVCKHRIHIAFPASMPERIKGLFWGVKNYGCGTDGLSCCVSTPFALCAKGRENWNNSLSVPICAHYSVFIPLRKYFYRSYDKKRRLK